MYKRQRESVAETETQPPTTTQENTTKNQYGIAALFWLTFIFGLAIAYLQRLDAPSIVAGGIGSVAIGLVVGAIFGLATKKMADAMFWSCLISAFGYISVSSEPLFFQLGHRLAWAGTGAVSGAIAATVFPKNIFVNLILCALGGGIVMLAYWLISKEQSADLNFDVFFGAPLIGIGVSFFVRILMWLESRNNMPRYITATWLMVVVIIGNVVGGLQ